MTRPQSYTEGPYTIRRDATRDNWRVFHGSVFVFQGSREKATEYVRDCVAWDKTAVAPKPGTLIDEDARSFIRRCPCWACLQEGKVMWGCEAAHIDAKRNSGDEKNLIPLCNRWGTPFHHHEFHQHGIETFAAKYGDLRAAAVDYWTSYVAQDALAF